MEHKRVVVIGGGGFLGRYTVQCLAKKGWGICVVGRHATRATHLKTQGQVGQISFVNASLNDQGTLGRLFSGAYAVVNLAGILYEKKHQTFNNIHHKGAQCVAQIASESGVNRLIHVSALGVDCTQSRYALTKKRGEEKVLAFFPQATILRPSVIFGDEDQFLNKFLSYAQGLVPILPLIGKGTSEFQPVYVGDVAQGIERALQQPEACGKIFELGGPDVYTLDQIFNIITRPLLKKPRRIFLPFAFARLIGLLLQNLPRPPLTKDQVFLLEHPNKVSKNTLTFNDLSIKPRSLESYFLSRQ